MEVRFYIYRLLPCKGLICLSSWLSHLLNCWATVKTQKTVKRYKSEIGCFCGGGGYDIVVPALHCEPTTGTSFVGLRIRVWWPLDQK